MFQLLIGYTAHAYGADEVRNPLFEVSVLRFPPGLAAWHMRERTSAVRGLRAWIHTRPGARSEGSACVRVLEARGPCVVLTTVALRTMQIHSSKGSVPPVDGITRLVTVRWVMRGRAALALTTDAAACMHASESPRDPCPGNPRGGHCSEDWERGRPHWRLRHVSACPGGANDDCCLVLQGRHGLRGRRLCQVNLCVEY